MLNKISARLPIELRVDNNNAFDAVHLTTQVSDAKLRIDIADIKESVQDSDVSVKWCPGDEMIANSLTKRGANTSQLLNLLNTGSLDRQHFKGDRYTGWRNFGTEV